MKADFGGRLNYLTNEMCQMNTRVSHIARRQAHMAGFARKQARMAGFAPSPSLERPTASPSVNDKDDEDNAGSSVDDEMMTSQ